MPLRTNTILVQHGEIYLKGKNRPVFLRCFHHNLKDKLRSMEFRSKQKEVPPIMAAMTRHLDDQVGRLIQTLEELGIEENTLIFLLSDNGGAMTAAETEQGLLRLGVVDFIPNPSGAVSTDIERSQRQLIDRGIRDTRVIEAMRRVPRRPMRRPRWSARRCPLRRRPA